MNFIFPQNYNFKNKILGIIDYSTAILNVSWFSILLIIVNILFNDINIKFFLIIFFFYFCIFIT